jgi:FdhD protein
VDLVLNGRFLVRAACLPTNLEDLAVGLLASEGVLDDAGAIAEVRASGDRTKVEVRADVDPDRLVLFRKRVAVSSGCGGGAASGSERVRPVESDARFRPEDLADRMKDLLDGSALFRETGGVHAAAVTDGRALDAFAEDIGRHNAVDKAIGRCLRGRKAWPPPSEEKAAAAFFASRALLVTGRASADLLAKAARVGLPVVVSRGAVTSRAVEAAAAARVALVGFARAGRMNVYTAPWRLGLEERGP